MLCSNNIQIAKIVDDTQGARDRRVRNARWNETCRKICMFREGEDRLLITFRQKEALVNQFLTNVSQHPKNENILTRVFRLSPMNAREPIHNIDNDKYAKKKFQLT
jgi:hypothetical protein